MYNNYGQNYGYNSGNQWSSAPIGWGNAAQFSGNGFGQNRFQQPRRGNENYIQPQIYRNAQKEKEDSERREKLLTEKRRLEAIRKAALSAFTPYFYDEKSLLGLSQPQIDQCEKLGKTPLFQKLNAILETEEVQARIFKPITTSADKMQMTMILNSDKFAVRLEKTGKNSWKLRHLLAKWIVEHYDFEMMQFLCSGTPEDLRDKIVSWHPSKFIRTNAVGLSYEIISGMQGKMWSIKLMFEGQKELGSEQAMSQEEAENQLALNWLHDPSNGEKLLQLSKMPEKKPSFETKDGIKKNEIKKRENKDEINGNPEEPVSKKLKPDKAEPLVRNPIVLNSGVTGYVPDKSDKSSVRILEEIGENALQEKLNNENKDEVSKTPDEDTKKGLVNFKAKVAKLGEVKNIKGDIPVPIVNKTIPKKDMLDLDFLYEQTNAADYLETQFLRIAKDTCNEYTYEYTQVGSKYKCDLKLGENTYSTLAYSELKSKVCCQIECLPKLIKFKYPKYTIQPHTKTTNWKESIQQELRDGVPVPIKFWQDNHFKFPRIKQGQRWDK